MEAVLNSLISLSKRRVENTDITFIRPIYNTIEWNSRLILIKGCRGVGKTYLMLQFLKKSTQKSIYLTLDNLYFLTNTISETVEILYNSGFRIFALDEIHKYPNWSIEIKNIYDNFPDIKMIITSSSALDIMAGTGDLSRRLDTYVMKGLSFSEYCNLEYGDKLPRFSLDDLLLRHNNIFEEVYSAFHIGKKFNTYLKKGYYPYYKEAASKYHSRLLTVIMQVIEVDMPALFNTDYESSRQMKKLLSLISRIGPFTPNISKLSRDLQMSRNSVLTYLDYLSEAGIINIMKSSAKSDSAMTKPDKVYLENTNLLYAFDADLVNNGTLRETFVFNALINNGTVSTPAKGDFLYNDQYVIEVGGPSKNFHQLSGIPNGILVKEGIEKGANGILPMWMLGLLG